MTIPVDDDYFEDCPLPDASEAFGSLTDGGDPFESLYLDSDDPYDDDYGDEEDEDFPEVIVQPADRPMRCALITFDMMAIVYRPDVVPPGDPQVVYPPPRIQGVHPNLDEPLLHPTVFPPCVRCHATDSYREARHPESGDWYLHCKLCGHEKGYAF